MDGCLTTSAYRGTITATDVAAKSFYIGTIPDQNGINPYVDVGHQWWDGDLDDVTIWNRALTNEEVSVIAQPVCKMRVSISKNARDTICVNTSVTFTASVTNGPLTPIYLWKLNGNDFGTFSDTYSSTALSDGDVISCVVMSPAGCISDTSNSIRMTVNSNQPLSISIASNDADNIIYADYLITFTAVPTNAGTSPLYQWKVNGNNAGTNNSTFTTSTLADNAIVTCVLTSNTACSTGNPATSNNIQVTVNANQSLGVTVSSDDADNIICPGTAVMFTAAITNNAAAPVYQWKLNGNNTGTNSLIYSSNTFVNGDVVQCSITRNAVCVTSSPAVSNNIAIHVPAPVFLGKDSSLCSSDYINLNVADTFLSYHWNTGSTLKSILVTQPGKYWVEAQDRYGCASADTINFAQKNCGFFIPTAFTPNGDGRNDLFKPLISGTISAYRFAVYDRWGKKVFETNDIMKGWDGTYPGQLQLSGVFIWLCEYQPATQPTVQKTGTVMLIR